MTAGAAALGLAALLLLACAGPAPQPTGQAAGAPTIEALTALRRDGTLVELRVEPLPDGSAAPAVGEEQAVALARERLGLAADAPAVAREVLLTVKGVADIQARFEAQPVWLIRFEGTGFVGDPCTCGDTPARPATLIAVDPTNGALVATLGI